MKKWIGQAHENGTEEPGRCDTLVNEYGYEVAGVYQTSRWFLWFAFDDGGTERRGTGVGTISEARTLARKAAAQ